MDEVPLSSLLWRAPIALALVTANAFFVAAEFALVAARRSRLEDLAAAGDKKATRAQRAIQSLDQVVAGAQFGVALSSIGLVWVAAPAVTAALRQIFGNSPAPLDRLASPVAGIVIAFGLLAALHLVFGMVIPKSLALNHPESVARWIAAPLMAFVAATRPLVSLLSRGASAILRLASLRTPSETERIHHPEELMSMVRQSQASGHFDTQDVRLIEGVLEFSEKTARDVMTPRTEVIALEADLTVEDAAARVAEAGRSRYPLIRESLDDIIGVVHVKEVLAGLQSSRYEKVESLMQEALFVPGSREIEDLLNDMQRLKQQMAVVLDEYGGTAGIVTMEDLLEEIVGQIFDEYDEPDDTVEPPPGARALAGAMEIDEANERFGLGIPSDSYTTVGGYVFGTLGRLPRVGDRVPLDKATLEVAEMEERRVGTLRILPPTEGAA